MGFPASPIRVLAFGATLLGCGSAGDTPAPSPDASTSADVASDTSEPTSDAGPVDAAKQPPDAEKQPPDADPCQGVRCAAPPPCDQPCTTICCCDRTCPPADAAIDGEVAGLDAASKEAGAICSRASDCRLRHVRSLRLRPARRWSAGSGLSGPRRQLLPRSVRRTVRRVRRRVLRGPVAAVRSKSVRAGAE